MFQRRIFSNRFERCVHIQWRFTSHISIPTPVRRISKAVGNIHYGLMMLCHLIAVRLRLKRMLFVLRRRRHLTVQRLLIRRRNIAGTELICTEILLLLRMLCGWRRLDLLRVVIPIALAPIAPAVGVCIIHKYVGCIELLRRRRHLLNI